MSPALSPVAIYLPSRDIATAYVQSLGPYPHNGVSLKLEKSDKKEGANVGKILLVEESPPDAILHCMLRDAKVVTAVMPLSELKFSIGDYVRLEIDEDDLYLFDQASEERIVI